MLFVVGAVVVVVVGAVVVFVVVNTPDDGANRPSTKGADHSMATFSA